MPRLTPDLVRAIEPHLASWARTQLRQRRAPGAQIAVRVGEELVCSRAFGQADLRTGEPLTTRHLFRVASHSKLFTATAVMLLVQQRRLRLDDTVGELLPTLAATGLAPVTVRELLSHTGGVIRDGVDADFWTLERPFPDAAQLLDLAAQEGLVYAPQQYFKYSNIGYGLLGLILEQATGRPYAEHLQAAVCEPLGLRDTGPEHDPARAGEYAAGHSRPVGEQYRRVAVEHIDTGALAAATGFFATAEDLSAFGAAHVLGADTALGLTDASRRLMQREEHRTAAEGDDAYGLGHILRTVGGRRFCGHSGGYPGHITRTLIDASEGLVVSVLTNSVDGPAASLAAGIAEIVALAEKDPAPHQGLPEGLGPEALDRFTGSWATLWGQLDIWRLGDRLVALDPTQPSPTDVVHELRVVDESTLAVEDADGYDAAGELIPVQVDESGRAVSLRWAGVTHRPVEAYEAWLGEGLARPGTERDD